MYWLLYSSVQCVSVSPFSAVQLCTVCVSIPVLYCSVVYSACQYPVQYGSVLYSTSQSKRTALYSTVQCMSVETYSIVQYCTVQFSRNVQWCTVLYSIYQCPVQCGTVFVQCKSVKHSAFLGMSVVFETSSVKAIAI